MYNKMNKTKGEEGSYGRISKLLFEKPTYRFHIREMARLTGLNPNTVISVVKKLANNGLAKTDKKKHIVEIFANVESKEFIWKKRIFNLSEIYRSRIIELIVEKFNPELISVIGSYSRGEDIEKSDIDIVLISQEKKDIDLTKFERLLDRKIHLLVLDYKRMSNEFYTNLINGAVLYGFVREK